MVNSLISSYTCKYIDRLDFYLIEMAERHDTNEILHIARKLVLKLKKLIENK